MVRFCKDDKGLKRLHKDGIGRLRDWEEFRNIFRDGADLRIEEVHSANRISDLLKINLRFVSIIEMLLIYY